MHIHTHVKQYIAANPANNLGEHEAFEVELEQRGPFYDGESDYGPLRVYYNGTTPVAWHNKDKSFYQAR